MSFFIEYFNSIVGALAAIGAVASIYYLIQEMREQNRVARANARQNVADSHQEIALEGMKTVSYTHLTLPTTRHV